MTDLMTMDRRTLMATLAALAVPAGASAKAAPLTAANLKSVQAFIDGYVSAKKLPGMVYGIRRAGEAPVYLKAGTLDFDTPIKTDERSIYRVYSMTKPIIGAASMRLVQEGKLKLEQPLSDILPEFKNMKVITDQRTGATAPAKNPILIRHLLTHTAGFSYSIGRGPLAEAYIKNGIVPGSREVDKAPGADLAPARDLKTFAERLSKMPLDFEPGARWQYAVGIDLMGYVIEKVSGTDLYSYLAKTIFRPLNMVDTDFIVPASKINRFASVYALQDGKMVKTDDRLKSPFARDRDLPSGGGGLVSTAVDYLRFTTMLVNEGELDGARILKPQSVELMRTNFMPPGVMFGGRNGYGAAVAVVLPGGQAPAPNIPPSTYWWFGIAGTQMWIDPLNRLSAVLMIQQNPTTYPVQNEVRVATYKDLAAMNALKA